MDIVDVAVIATTVGTVGSFVLLLDFIADVQAAGDDPILRPLARFRFWAELLRFLAQASFFAAALIVKFRVPGTFGLTVRYLLLAVPILLAAGSILSWRSKRRLLREVSGE